MKGDYPKQADSKIGHRIRMLRKEYGLTNEMLAELTDKSVSYTALICRGQRTPSLELLMKYRNIFNTTLDFMVYGEVKAFSEDEFEQDYISRLSPQEKEFLLKLCKLIFSFSCSEPDFNILYSVAISFIEMKLKQRNGGRNEL